MQGTPEICIIGRTNFSTGIGAVCYSACELLSRYFPVCLYPTDLPPHAQEYISLPNNRLIPICKDFSNIKVYFYTDVLWNGEYDLNYTLIPLSSNVLRIAHIAYDSDLFPNKWVSILNERFDVAYFTSHHLEEIAINSGIKIAVGTLPVGLDFDELLCRDFRKNDQVVRFGSIAAFHKRKGSNILIDAFIEEFKGQDDVELVMHSNLAIGSVLNDIQKKTNELNVKNIVLSHSNLNNAEKLNLLESFDIFVNFSRGEGYSIGPREALALGKQLVLSEIGPHYDLLGIPGTYGATASIRTPARYPEIDNLIIGHQFSVSVEDARFWLRKSYESFLQHSSCEEIRLRRQRAAEFSFSALAVRFAETIVPEIIKFKDTKKSSTFSHIPVSCRNIAKKILGEHGESLSVRNRYVLPAHDGGFFSVFNAFMSHLCWDVNEDKCHMVLPDWDVSRLLKRQGDKKLISFCYGKPDDGNIWLKIFKPLYDLSDEQMNDEHFLYSKSVLPETTWNQHREPLLTYVYAYDLYISGEFQRFRKQYHEVYKRHIHLRDEYQREIEDFCHQKFNEKFMIAAHVKHPSHMIEQPGMCIAHAELFINAIFEKVEQLGFSIHDDNWGVFLATDQDRVVAQFKDVFKDKVCFYDDVRRTKISEDELYDALSDEDKAAEGFQVQHLVAADPDSWSFRMAWEVIRDAITMSHCRTLYHVVSNVSTAVSYINPAIELHFIKSE
ncbi:glycosyltransferase [Dickeya undicola]|uniref:glycosyltransferase n=1 Tax=Dickeya undicola TaxID=1577887 RepID=UPI00190F5A65|nr:glycosyltransferase [Dickeya undicola]